MEAAQNVPPDLREQRIVRVTRDTGSYNPTAHRSTPKLRQHGRRVPVCTRDQCSTCERQFLNQSDRDLLKSHNNYLYLNETDGEQLLRELGNSIEHDFQRLRCYVKPAVEIMATLEEDAIEEIYKATFPTLIQYIQLNAVLCRSPEKVRILENLNDSLKYGNMFGNQCKLDSKLDLTMRNLKKRLEEPPSHFVYLHSQHIQVGWDRLLFDFVHSHVFVDLNHDTYLNAKLICAAEPNALHKDKIFSFERGVLILQSQQLYYHGMANFLEGVLQTDASVEKPIPVLDPGVEVKSVMNALHVAYEWVDELLPLCALLLSKQQERLSTFLENGKANIEEIDAICEWLVDGDEATDSLPLEHAISTHLVSLADRLIELHRLRDALQRFRAALKGWMTRSVSKTKVLDARDRLEKSLFGYIRAIAGSYLKNHNHCGQAFEELIDQHNSDFSTLLQCDADHVFMGDTKDFWKCYVLLEAHFPAVLSLEECELAVQTDRDSFREGTREALNPQLSFARSVSLMLHQVGPCCDPDPLRGTKSSQILNSVIYPRVARRASKAMGFFADIKESDPQRWSTALWRVLFLCLENAWEEDDVDEDERAFRRRCLRMDKRKRAPKPKAMSDDGDEASQIEDDEATFDTEITEDVQNPEDLAETQAAITRARNRSQKPADPHVFDIHEQNRRWGTEWTVRPSQFGEEDHLRFRMPKKPRRRDAVEGGQEETAAALNEIQLPEFAPPEPIQPLVFTDPDRYYTWRQLFPHPDERTGGRARMRWIEFRRVLAAPPLNFVEERVGGMIEQKWRRPKSDGLEETVLTMHMPHGGENSWLEREHLQTCHARLRHAFGWGPDDFVLRE